MSDIYQKIRAMKVSEEIAEQIRTLIKEGKLRPGQKLPPERAFAQTLGVGRSSLREAMNTLATQGFIEIRKRQGIFVSNISDTLITDPLRQILKEDNSELPHLYELRKDIEMASAWLAAERRTPEDLIQIRQLLENMEQGVKNGAISLRDDLDFHLAIAHATRNFLRVHVLKNIFGLSGEFLGVVLGKLSRKPGNLPVICSHHRAIFEAIEARDKDQAREQMRTHLTWVEEKWRVVWEYEITPG
ncbi:FadR family transcriptional regulator [Desulfonema ishimotonii]|uniref:Pyruvate dehydrogenase complex repressor n=1 Tax=Desulfonema ishimotonii TaxID=45657 RepID=A0A401FWH7_9BACT|nr:FadR/GntR family transcriptional regulator [Desulfonema ishimotonii]GBC61316.1 FadR family transcriptional regulator [Desulfonema ishimotonii]